MPDPNAGQRVTANWEAVLGNGPEDNIHEDYFLFNQFSKGPGFMKKSGGDFIAVPLEYAQNTTVASYSDLDPIDTTRIDVFDRAQAEWKEVAGTVTVSAIELDRNKGEGKVFDLLPAKLENLRTSMRARMNEQMFGTGLGNGSKDITGLQALVSSTPTLGTVQGISRVNFPFWRNQQTTGTQSASAFDNLRAAMRSTYNSCSNGVGDQHPAFIVTTQTAFQGFDGLLLANERFESKSDGDGDFKNEVLKFKGAKISYDNDCLSGAMYFLNPKFIKLAYISGSWFKMRPEVTPANQTADIYLVRTACNLVVTNSRRLGVVTAIT